MDIAIIGAGFCGLAVAWHFLNHQPSFPDLKIHLFDTKGIGQGASGIAAGLLHPYAGAHAKLNWRGLEGFQATFQLLKIASQTLKRPVTATNLGILRLALNKEQRMDFQLCAEKYPHQTEWINSANCQNLIPGCAQAPGLWIKSGLTVYSSLYLQGLWQACQQHGVQFEQRWISSLQETMAFDLTIVTMGADSTQLPELSTLPIHKVKGQVLELKWPAHTPPLTCSLNSHIYIVMTESQNSCLVGATYERNILTETIDLEIAQKEILPKTSQLFSPLQNSPILACYAGMRAVTPQHQPLIKCLSPKQWVLTGMGSKGLLYHALFAQEMVDRIWSSKFL